MKKECRIASATRDAVMADAVDSVLQRDEWSSQWQEALVVETQ